MPSFPFFNGRPLVALLANYVTKSSPKVSGTTCYSYSCDGADPSPITKVPPLLGTIEAPPSAPRLAGLLLFDLRRSLKIRRGPVQPLGGFFIFQDEPGQLLFCIAQ